MRAFVSRTNVGCLILIALLGALSLVLPFAWFFSTKVQRGGYSRWWCFWDSLYDNVEALLEIPRWRGRDMAGVRR